MRGKLEPVLVECSMGGAKKRAKPSQPAVCSLKNRANSFVEGYGDEKTVCTRERERGGTGEEMATTSRNGRQWW